MMFGTGFLAGLVGKVVGLGSVAKVAVVTTTAALTMAVAGVGVLTVASAEGGSAATEVIDQAAAVVDSASPVAVAESVAQSDGEAPVGTPAATTSASAGAGVAGSAGPAEASLPIPSLPIPTLPIPSLPVPALPDLSGLTQIPTQVLNCLAPVLDLVKGLPAVSPGQISQIGPAVVGCISEIVGALPLPLGLNACISAILGFVGNITSQMPTGIPSIGNFDVTACIPTGLPTPTGQSGGLPFMGGGFPFGR